MKCIFFFRDTGISLQIQLYQLYSEIFVFLTYNVSVVLFLFFNPIDTIFAREGIILPVAQFIVYVVQPLFYLHGDPSFRQSCLNLGTWNALKRALQKSTFEQFWDFLILMHISSKFSLFQCMYTPLQNVWSGSKSVVTFGLIKILTHPINFVLFS